MPSPLVEPALLLLAFGCQHTTSVPQPVPVPVQPFVGTSVRDAMPLLGYGNEMLLQSVNDTELNGLVAQTGSRLQRFPGGTPSGFWNWQLGWEWPPFPGPSGRHDTSITLARPTSPLNWSAYLNFTEQHSIFVPNILTSNMSFELQGLVAQQAAGVPIGAVELGNEM